MAFVLHSVLATTPNHERKDVYAMPLDGEILELPISTMIDQWRDRPDLYPRQNHCQYTVVRYASLTTKAPPVRVNQDYIGIDYLHRCLAALERGETMIPAIVINTRNDRHLLDLAVEANFNHGVALSQDDKKRLARMRYDPNARKTLMNQKVDIAIWLRVDVSTVRRWLENMDYERRQTRNQLIVELDDRGFTQEKIAERVGCSIGLVNNRLNSEVLNQAEMKTLPAGFTPELFDVWNFTRNDNGLGHFGATDPRIIHNLVWRYAWEPHDVVLDVFAGGGTTIDVCREWPRECLAFDRRPRPARGDAIQRHDIITDGFLPEIPCWDHVKLAFLDPPYAAQAAGQYSDDPTDLGNMPFDDFERVLSELVNALGGVLRQGAAIALLIRNSQWSTGPEHRIRRHDRNIENLVTVPFEREIIAPSGKDMTTTVREWARETRDCVVVSRKLLIWRV